MFLKKKFFLIAILIVLFMVLAACGGNSKKSGSANVKESDTGNVQTNVNTPEGNITVDFGKGGENLPLPEAYPEDIVPLTDDANILNVRDTIKSSIGICYVTDLDMDKLLEFYETELGDADDFRISKEDYGVMLTGKKNNIFFQILIQKGVFDSIPKHKGKVSANIGVHFLDTESETIASDSKLKWPTSNLPGVPVLEGSIENVLEEETVILEIRVDGMDTVLQYVEELKKAGFTSDDYPERDSDYIQFIAFGEDGYVNFSYDDSEKFVTMEYGE